MRCCAVNHHYDTASMGVIVTVGIEITMTC